MVLTKGKLKGT